jgi:hypothetical protein
MRRPRPRSAVPMIARCMRGQLGGYFCYTEISGFVTLYIGKVPWMMLKEDIYDGREDLDNGQA